MTRPAYKILVADDQNDLRKLVRMTLAVGNYIIVEAGNGLDAIALARQENPDLALLDIMMQGMDGLQVCRAIREDKALRGMKVVLVTARGQQSDIQQGEAAGADDYIVKPFSPSTLLLRVEQLLQSQEGGQ